MYNTPSKQKKFSFTKFISNAVPNLASAPQDITLSPQEEDAAFTHQLTLATPLRLSPLVYRHAGITSSPTVSASIHKALLKNGVLATDSSAVHTDKITRGFASQVAGIPGYAQRKLVNFLFFWEGEEKRWVRGEVELEELRVRIEGEKERGGDVRALEERVAAVQGDMRVVPSLRGRDSGGL